jgi:hypothetical protein
VYRKISASLVFVLLITYSFSQEVLVKGLFIKDTVKIGEEVPYSLSVIYPRSYNIIFPDSTYDFQPFEYHERAYYNTVSDNITSLDSVIYYLSTFEIDSVQYLQLPIFMKENTAFLKIPKSFNYPVFLLIIGLLLVIIIVGLLFFGKGLARWIRILIMRRNHKRFVNRFYLKLAALRDNRAGVEPEGVLADWKKYMEKLEREPYTKLTTKELIGLHADQRLKDDLRSIDRYIYGNIKEKPLHEHFNRLLEYSIERYDVRLNEIKNG